MAQNVFGNICCTPLVSTSSNAALRMVLNVRSTWVGFGKKEFASQEGLQPMRLSQFVFHHGFSPKTKPADSFQFSSGDVSSCSDVSLPSKAWALFEGLSQKGHNQFLPPNGTYAQSSAGCGEKGHISKLIKKDFWYEISRLIPLKSYSSLAFPHLG